MDWPVVVCTDSASATRAVGAHLARICSPGDVILLIGELGAGKTVFAQGFASLLGVKGPVTSPTFTLVHQYRCCGASGIETLIHADVFRTGSLAEVVDLALTELVEERAIALVEWGDLAAPALGDDVLEVTLEHTTGPAEQRSVKFSGRGRWSGRAADLSHALLNLAP